MIGKIDIISEDQSSSSSSYNSQIEERKFLGGGNTFQKQLATTNNALVLPKSQSTRPNKASMLGLHKQMSSQKQQMSQVSILNEEKIGSGGHHLTRSRSKTFASNNHQKLRTYRKKSEHSKGGAFEKQSARSKNGRWSLMEHVRFLEALKLHGKNWKRIEDYVQTRTSTQARSHAQKFFGNILKSTQSMEEFLDKISQESLNQLKVIAQQSQDSKIQVTEELLSDQPEAVKLLMMHMSKGYHQEEAELVERQFLQMMNGADHTMSSGTFSCPQSPDLVAVGKKRVAQNSGVDQRISQKRKINTKSDNNNFLKLQYSIEQYQQLEDEKSVSLNNNNTDNDAPAVVPSINYETTLIEMDQIKMHMTPVGELGQTVQPHNNEQSHDINTISLFNPNKLHLIDKLEDHNLMQQMPPPYFTLSGENHHTNNSFLDFHQPPWTLNASALIQQDTTGVRGADVNSKPPFSGIPTTGWNITAPNNSALRKFSNDSGFNINHAQSFLNLVKARGGGSRCSSFDINECFFKEQAALHLQQHSNHADDILIVNNTKDNNSADIQ